jgi:hypothetical protein
MKSWKHEELCVHNKIRSRGLNLGDVFKLGYRKGKCICLKGNSRTVDEAFIELGVDTSVAVLKNCIVHYQCRYSEQGTSDIRAERDL